MSWQENVTFDKEGLLLYKGINIGISREFVEDIKANISFVNIESIFEENYIKIISEIRNKKLDIILDQDKDQ